MTSAPTLMTAKQLAKLSIPNKSVELVRGHLIVCEPPGYQHGDVAARALVAIAVHVNKHRLGRVLAAETGFHIFRDPDTVRGPDVAFVSAEREPKRFPSSFAEFAPDLAVEVLSPSDRRGKVNEKIADWLAAGTSLVWAIDPKRRTARVCRADGTESLLTAEDSLDGEDVLPGFSVSLSELVDY